MKPGLSEHDLLVSLLTVQNAIQRRADAFFASFGLTDAQFNILNLMALSHGRPTSSRSPVGCWWASRASPSCSTAW